MYFFTQISERSTCTHLHHSNLDSGGQIYLKMTKIFSAYAKTTCLVEFFQTIIARVHLDGLKDDSLWINCIASNGLFQSQKRFPKWRQHFVKTWLTDFFFFFFSKAQNFVEFRIIRFCSNSPVCGPNTYQIMETLDFQYQHQQ